MKLLSILCTVTVFIAVTAAEQGILEITFGRASAQKDINGDRCDNCFMCQNPCDPYMLVRVDGNERFRTRTVWNENDPDFQETFNSGVISKDAKITIEMWDNDDGDSSDDLMSKWTNLDIQTLVNSYHLGDSYNSIDFHAHWTPMNRNEIAKDRHYRRD